MCRYAMSTYKPHYACFECRKSFKRRLLGDIQGGVNKDAKVNSAKCPDCGNIMADMGLDFEAPKKKDIKAWNHMALLHQVDITFHSCGCSGPGYIPKDSDALIEHFSRIKDVYLEHQSFWSRRTNDPKTQSDVAKDKHRNESFLSSIPYEFRKGTKSKPIYDSRKAQIYWGEKVADIERKINTIKNTTLRSSAFPNA